MLYHRFSSTMSGYLLLILTVLFWAGNFVLGRGVRGDVPPIALGFWRVGRGPVFAAALFLPRRGSPVAFGAAPLEDIDPFWP